MTRGSRAESTPSVAIAARTPGRAVRAACAAGLDPVVVLSKGDCAGPLRGARREALRAGARLVAIHAYDWEHQPLPQLLELAALRLRLPRCIVIGNEGELQAELSRGRLAADVAALPVDGVRAGAIVGSEAVRLALAGRRSRRRRPAGDRAPAVVAAWDRAPGTNVGGSVTHVSGILEAFRRAGLRVGLVTTSDPPPRLAATIDDLEVLPARSAAARLTGEVTAIGSNRLGRRAMAALAGRMNPAFLYQRYDAFIWYGLDVADRIGVPAVVEWNSSQVWTKARWAAQHSLKRPFDPLLAAVERHVVRRADLLTAVSDRSAEMAIAAGAPPERVVVVPNGVDIAAIDDALADAGAAPGSELPAGAPRIGWVGSFGPWHGAEVLVRALARMPDDVGAVMVGDGIEREACRRLARELGVEERIEWPGAIPHPEAVRALARCDVLASPHVPLEGQAFFGSPTKLFEYMAIGRPIVASSLEQIGDVLEDGTTARLVRPGDVDDLVRGLSEVLAMPQRGRALGLSARRDAEERHTWNQRAQVILERVRALGVELPDPATVEA